MTKGNLNHLWRSTTGRHRLVVIFAILALIVFFTPIQKFISLARYQHYGLAIGTFGLGYLAQVLLSHKHLTRWAVRSYLATGVYFSGVGITFFNNPWLETKLSIQTTENDQMRGFLIFSYSVFAVLVALIWIKCILEDGKPHSAKDNKGSDDEISPGET